MLIIWIPIIYDVFTEFIPIIKASLNKNFMHESKIINYFSVINFKEPNLN